mmetsp:Transcript_27572/g.57566  ORF Transcript_27572/g.57566 Transcript_27572/m.57566 type:complete len:238 (-) Transcript_27572:500-1213(-)
MKNCRPFVVGPELAIETIPHPVCVSLSSNSSAKGFPHMLLPPSFPLVPDFLPPWIIKLGMDLWNLLPSYSPFSASNRKFIAVFGTMSQCISTSMAPMLVNILTIPFFLSRFSCSHWDLIISSSVANRALFSRVIFIVVDVKDPLAFPEVRFTADSSSSVYILIFSLTFPDEEDLSAPLSALSNFFAWSSAARSLLRFSLSNFSMMREAVTLCFTLLEPGAFCCRVFSSRMDLMWLKF